MVDLERRLRDYGTELDSALDPVAADEIYRRAEVLDVAVLSPPRRRWTPLRVVLAAAAVALLLFLPILLLRDSTEPPVVDDPVTTTVAVTSTSVPATTTPSVTGAEDVFLSETSLGTIEWTRVESDLRLEPIASSDGVIQAVQYDSEFNFVGYLQSSDGITWEPGEAPEIEPWRYVSVGNETLAPVSPGSFGGAFGASSRRVIFRSWAEDPEADAALFRQEGSEWAPVALPATEPPSVVGLEILGPEFQGVAGKDGTNWVAPLVYLAQVPWSDAYGTFPYDPFPGADPTQIGPWPIWNEALQVLEIFPPSQDGFTVPSEPLATLNVEVVGSTIEFRDAESGDLVHTVEATLPGWTPEELLAGIRGWGLFDVSFVVSNQGELSVVRPPWPMSEEWILSGIVESSGRYYTHTLTLGENYSAAAIHLYESEEGLVWNEVSSPKIIEGLIDYVTLAGGGDRLYVIARTAGGAETIWTSTDARDWQPVDPSLASFPESTDFGWLSNNYDSVGISADGENWERLDLPGSPVEPTFVYLDGLFVLGPTGDTAPFVTWVGRFVD